MMAQIFSSTKPIKTCFSFLVLDHSHKWFIRLLHTTSVATVVKHSPVFKRIRIPMTRLPFINRRQFLNRFGMGLGGIALSEMLAKADSPADLGSLGGTHFAPKAKRIIYLFMSGGPSQLDLYDHKPLLNKLNGEQLPDSVRGGQRLTGMSGNQSSIPIVGSPFKFTQYGPGGATVSELFRTSLRWRRRFAL